MVFAGVDAGSRSIKVLFVDGTTLDVIAAGMVDQGVEQDVLAHDLFDRLLREASLSRADVVKTVATGYGRNRVSFADTTITEITCHACGVRRVVPDVMTIVEIGGQDSKLIRLNGKGSVRDFAMNDRCAAGTGRFLEIVATRLAVPLDALGDMAARASRPAAISSMCAVFAETEIVGLLAAGTPPEEIVAGVQQSVAKRVASMAGRSVDDPVVFTGGVALIPGMPEALSAVLCKPVRVAPAPQMTGALGAAILASQQ